MSAYVGTIREAAPEDGCSVCESSTPCANHSEVVGYRWRVFSRSGRTVDGMASTRDLAWADATEAEAA